VFIAGLMGRFTKASGLMALKKAKEFGKAFLETLILVNGNKAKQTAMEFISGRTVIDTRVSGATVSSTVRARTSLQTAMSLQAPTSRASPMEWASTSGKMAASTSVSFKKDRNTAKASGRNDLMPQTATHMREAMKMIRRMVSVNLRGRAATCTKATTKKTNATATAKCTGLTAHATKESGRKAFNTASVVWSSPMAASKRATLKTMSSKVPLRRQRCSS